MIIFGGRDSILGSFQMSETKCDYCSQENKQVVTVFGKYAHIFWLPLFPYGREAIAECTHCKRTLEENEFSPNLKSQYEKYKSVVETPFWHWTGLGLVGFSFLFVLIVGLTT